MPFSRRRSSSSISTVMHKSHRLDLDLLDSGFWCRRGKLSWLCELRKIWAQIKVLELIFGPVFLL